MVDVDIAVTFYLGCVKKMIDEKKKSLVLVM